MMTVLCLGGSLSEKLSDDPVSEEELKQVLRQVAAGLRYIHSQHLVHLDLKPGRYRCVHVYHRSVSYVCLHPIYNCYI